MLVSPIPSGDVLGLLSHGRPLLAALTLAAPWWALALPVAVGFPLAAHLLTRWGGRPCVFPATRFVIQANTQSAQRSRVSQFLLLMVRVLALVMVVVAFMQPRWFTDGAVPHARGVSLIIVVDRSASMSRTSSGVSLFEEAKRRVKAVLDSLDPGVDQAVLLWADKYPSSALAKPTGNLTELKRLLNEKTVSHEAVDYDGALSLAEKLIRLPKADALPRTQKVMVFSDRPGTARWLETMADGLGPSNHVSFHQVSGPTVNIALRDLQVQPIKPVSGLTTKTSVEAANFSDRPQRVRVVFQAADWSETESILLKPGQAKRLDATIPAGTLPISQEGPVLVEARLIDPVDALVLDDRVGRWVDVVGAKPVVILTQNPTGTIGAPSELMARALDPEGKGLTAVRVRFETPGVFASTTFKPEEVVAVAPGISEEMSEVVRRGLLRHLEQGGVVIWCLGGSLDVSNLLAWQQETQSNLINEAHPIRWERGTFKLGDADFDNPLLAVFEGPARSGLLASDFGGRMFFSADTLAAVVLRFEDGSPALITRQVGDGQMAVIAFPIAPVQTDFVKGPAFVAMMNQLVHEFSPGRGVSSNPRPGDWIESSPSALLFEAVGPYVDGVGFGAEPQWVELDPVESDTRLVIRETRPDSKAADISVNEASSDEALVRPVELWPWFLLGGLVFLLGESLFLIQRKTKRAGVRFGRHSEVLLD